jgi:hypothetical protein
MHFIFGNYGDNTIAVIQWAYQKKLSDVCVVTINTGWSALGWESRSLAGKQWAQSFGFKTEELKPSHSYSDLIRDRQSFPNAKYQWCSTFLKALPFINFLDQVDDSCESVILLGSRRQDSRARINLPEFVEESEHYGGRRVWYPLYNLSKEERDALIHQAGFQVLNHRSLECHPCIHSQLSEFSQFEISHLETLRALESELKQSMFEGRFPAMSIDDLINERQTKAASSQQLELFDMGCGSKYVCGE